MASDMDSASMDFGEDDDDEIELSASEVVEQLQKVCAVKEL